MLDLVLASYHDAMFICFQELVIQKDTPLHMEKLSVAMS